MSDIVDRLRDRDSIVMSGLFHAVPTMQEAATEIEHLRLEHKHACQEVAAAIAERDAADEVSRTAQAYVGAMEAKLRAAREFVIRHPSLTLIDLAEFDAFLKMDAALADLTKDRKSK